MPRHRRTFSPEFKEQAVKAVLDASRPVVQVAKELDVHETTLGSWVNAYKRRHAGDELPLTVNERARLRELEREARELRMENEFLKKGVPRTREAA